MADSSNFEASDQSESFDVPDWFAVPSAKIAASIAAGLWNPPHDAILINHGNGVMEPLHMMLKPGLPLSNYVVEQAYGAFGMAGLTSIFDPELNDPDFIAASLPIVVALSTHERLARHVSLSLNDPRIRAIDLEKFINSITAVNPLDNMEDYLRRRAIEEAKVKELVEIHNKRKAVLSMSGVR